MKRSDIKHIASEIVRSMTNHSLTSQQKSILEHNARIVMENKLSMYIEKEGFQDIDHVVDLKYLD